MIKRELFIFIMLFIILALGVHFRQFIHHPLQHVQQLSTHQMPYHPLLYTLVLYLLIAFFRWIIGWIKKLFTRFS